MRCARHSCQSICPGPHIFGGIQARMGLDTPLYTANGDHENNPRGPGQKAGFR